jgi:hypothetical protein
MTTSGFEDGLAARRRAGWVDGDAIDWGEMAQVDAARSNNRFLDKRAGDLEAQLLSSEAT